MLNVVALGPTLPEAGRRAYRAVEMVQYEGKTFRRDIGARDVAPVRAG